MYESIVELARGYGWLCVGAVIGYVIAALMFMAKKTDDTESHHDGRKTKA